MQRIALLAASLMLAAPAWAQPFPDKASPREDGITEQRREMTRRGEAFVPQQNRESRQGDALEHETSQEWLKEAQTALRAGQLGQANEYLERAATRLLSRSTEPSQAGAPMQDNRLALITEARQSLQRRDRPAAERQIDQALLAR
jgi:hypothetical protein